MSRVCKFTRVGQQEKYHTVESILTGKIKETREGQMRSDLIGLLSLYNKTTYYFLHLVYLNYYRVLLNDYLYVFFMPICISV